jgi:predicted ATP-grasp superfamily ATP-dependent carboligase
MTTDIPAAFMELMTGSLNFRNYVQSLKKCDVEAVFSREDPLPGLIEALLVPYLALKKGF